MSSKLKLESRKVETDPALTWNTKRGTWAASVVLEPAWFLDGAYRDRTGDLRLAKPALSQLS
jgi:hypothetical protein